MNSINPQLVEQSIDGNLNSFGELYESVYNDLYRFCFYYLQNSDDASDAVQETALDAFKGISSLKNPASFKSWIFTIALVKCKIHIKTIIRHKNNVNADDLKDFVSGVDFSDSVLNALYIKKYISALKSDEKSIIILAVVLDYQMSEIANILKIPIGTVKSKLSRTLRKLRIKIKEEDVVLS
jgi:RNA polymerase sigma factor, sigma-70 family